MNYYQSRAFRTLKGGTPAMRRAILERFRERHGHLLIAAMPPKFVAAMLDSMQPHAARNWLKALRHLMAHCIATGLIAERNNPTLGIKAKVPRSDGHHTWSDEEIAQFEAHHPIGSKPRLALALALFTGQRRGDVIRMGRQHVHGDKISVNQQKAGKPLAIPMHPALRAVLAAMPSSHLTFLTSRTGRPYAPSDFSVQFRHWCDAAGLPHCSVHGLRKAACRRLAEAGCTPHQIMAITGHKTLAMVAHYTAAVDQERMAREAMAMLDGGEQIGNETVKSDRGRLSKPALNGA